MEAMTTLARAKARILGDARRNHTFEGEYNIRDSQVVGESKNEKTIDQ